MVANVGVIASLLLRVVINVLAFSSSLDDKNTESFNNNTWWL